MFMFRKMIIELTICCCGSHDLFAKVDFIIIACLYGFYFHICSKCSLVILENYSVEVCSMEPSLSPGSGRFRAVPSVFTSVMEVFTVFVIITPLLQL